MKQIRCYDGTYIMADKVTSIMSGIADDGNYAVLVRILGSPSAKTVCIFRDGVDRNLDAQAAADDLAEWMRCGVHSPYKSLWNPLDPDRWSVVPTGDGATAAKSVAEAARDFLNKIDEMTTADFAVGAENAEREALRAALAQFGTPATEDK